MSPYLLNSAQPRRLNHVSVYTGRGTSRYQSRLLYMNADALSVWREMGMRVTIIGESHRPAAQCDAFLRHAVFRVTSAAPPGGPDAHRCLP